MTTSEAVIKIRSRWKRAAAGSKRGQSLVEFSLAMPMLLITMTGMLSFGIVMHNFVVLTNAVGTTVTLLSMSRGQTADPCALAYTAMQSAAPSLTAASLGFTFVINGSTYTTTTCTAAAAGMVQGASAQMKVTYPCTLAVYGLSAPSCSLVAQTAEMIQ
jgi:Flp pilus assembly protein TadG